MGVFKLFKKKTAAVSEKTVGFTIDIRDDHFLINGARLEVPAHIDTFSSVLGKPRSVSFKTDANEQAVYESLTKERISQRVNYAWDDLGLMCYTNNGSVVNALRICLRRTKYDVPSDPRSLFGGNITINGGDWLPVILAGENRDTSRHARVGNYLLCASYADYDEDDAKRGENSFTGIEIQLA